MFHPLVDELPAAAARATLRQRRIVNLVDHRRHDAKGLGSIVVAAFTSRRLGIELGQAAREGSGLAFAGTQRGFQFLLHERDAGLQPSVALLQFSDSLGRRDAAGTGGNIHVGLVGIHAARIICTAVRPLNNYLFIKHSISG
jgi:hypothetical protein